MTFTFAHQNFNVQNIENSLLFYQEALGLHETRRKKAADGAFEILFLTDAIGTFALELTWLRDHPEAYQLGENESHLAFHVDDYDAAHAHHAKMGCICYENQAMGIYFITDPDGYWLEIVPKR